MPRAHRYYLPGHIWHLTHRCHNREFLLQEPTVRRQWIGWVRKAQTKYGLIVLGYVVTCNHIHLLVQDSGESDVIAKSMQLIQGQSAQQYNRKTGRQSAFWSDRYHATAVDSGTHLLRCLIYIDLNMVRAGVIHDPGEWYECSYREIQSDRVREGIVDRNRLAMVIGAHDINSLKEMHLRALSHAIQERELLRDSRWSESLAVGSQAFVSEFAKNLGNRIRGRVVSNSDSLESCTLRESSEVVYGEDESTFMPGDNTAEIDWPSPAIAQD